MLNIHQASGNLLESGLLSADVILCQAAEPINMSSALHQPCMNFSHLETQLRVVCLSAIEVNVLSVHVCSLYLTLNM